MTGGRWILVRRGLALAGYAVTVLAIALEEHRLGWLAIALLGASLLLRLRDRRRTEGPSEPEEPAE